MSKCILNLIKNSRSKLGTFDLQELEGDRFLAVAFELGLTPRFFGTQVRKVANEIIKGLDQVQIKNANPHEVKFLNRLQKDISNRASYFIEQSKALSF